jgi:uncharacterized protein YoxC
VRYAAFVCVVVLVKQRLEYESNIDRLKAELEICSSQLTEKTEQMEEMKTELNNVTHDLQLALER